MNDNHQNILETAIENGRQSYQLRTMHDGTPYLVTHKNENIHFLEKQLPQPIRKRGRFVFNDLDSFKAYCRGHRTDAMAFYFSRTESDFNELICQFDEHETTNAKGEPGSAQWREHVAILKFRRSVQFEWIRANSETSLSQTDLLRWLDKVEPSLIQPVAAEFRDFIKTMRTRRTRERVDSMTPRGKENTSDESTRIMDSSGHAPVEFIFAAPIYFGCDVFQILARVYWETDDGGRAVMTYHLHNLESIIAKMSDEIRADLFAEFKQTPLLIPGT